MPKTEDQITEESLEKYYLGKFVKYAPVGKSEIYGKIDRITIDTSRIPNRVIFILDSALRYEEELDDIHSLLTLL